VDGMFQDNKNKTKKYDNFYNKINEILQIIRDNNKKLENNDLEPLDGNFNEYGYGFDDYEDCNKNMESTDENSKLDKR
jgi:hypothetical protein